MRVEKHSDPSSDGIIMIVIKEVFRIIIVEAVVELYKSSLKYIVVNPQSHC